LRFLPREPLFGHIILAETAAAGAAATAADAGASGPGRLVGKSGVASTDLRPAGKVEVEGELVDAVTDAEFLGKGDPVTVVEVSGNRVVVSAAGAAGAEPDGAGGETERGKA
jgi:membrane-bound serine protease (ClpP class)